MDEYLIFSDKDWIWICKKFSDMDQELKNQYPLTSVLYIEREHWNINWEC